MQFDYQDKHYHAVLASDLQREGMGLELHLDSHAVAEVFYSDATGDFTVSLFEQSLPLPVIERLITEARVDLLPAQESLDKRPPCGLTSRQSQPLLALPINR